MGVAQIIAHPFQVIGNAVATVDDSSEDGTLQQVAVLVTTRKGERPMRPAYGITDPVFSSYDMAEVNAGLAMYLPGVRVRAVNVSAVNDVTERVELDVAGSGEL